MDDYANSPGEGETHDWALLDEGVSQGTREGECRGPGKAQPPDAGSRRPRRLGARTPLERSPPRLWARDSDLQVTAHSPEAAPVSFA